MSQRLWRAVLLLAVVLAFGVSFEMLCRVIGSRSPWLVLLLMFYLLGFFKVAEPLFLLRLPQGLRPLCTWELAGTVYRRLGVVAYGRVLRGSVLRYLNAAVYLDGGRRDLGPLRRHAEASEASHGIAGLLVLVYLGYVAMRGRWGVAAGFVMAELLVNVYPLLHLRYTRGRLERVERRRRGAGATRS